MHLRTSFVMFICTAQVHNTKCPQMDPNTYANRCGGAMYHQALPRNSRQKVFRYNRRTQRTIRWKQTTKSDDSLGFTEKLDMMILHINNKSRRRHVNLT